MKEAKKTQITEQICRQAQLMRKGGANQTQVAELLGVNPCTVSRIEAAGFDMEKYTENQKARREREKMLKEHPMRQWSAEISAEEQPEAQVPGQIRMEIPEKVEGVPINATYADEISREYPENVKLMRFQAGQVDKLIMKLDKLNDTMSMILRAVRRE